MSGLVARLLARLRGRTLVGGDEHGNLYYKWVESVSHAAAEEAAAAGEASTSTSSAVERRAVRTPAGSSPQKFDAALIPPEWSAWLRKTRRDPPSPEEAALNAARKERVRSLAAAIDAKRLVGGSGAPGAGVRPVLPAAGEAPSSSVAAPQRQQQQPQQHSAMSGTFSAETWTPPPAPPRKQEGEREEDGE